MKEVVFENGKLVLQKRKISQMDELFLIASKEHDKREMANRLQKESGFDFFYTKKDFLFVGDDEFETMNTYFGEDILNIRNDIGDDAYSALGNDAYSALRNDTSPSDGSTSKTVKRRPDNLSAADLTFIRESVVRNY